MQLVVRQVSEGDRSVFEQLHSEYIGEGHGEKTTPPSGWLDTVYSQAIERQRYLWLADMDGVAVGFCSFRIMPFFRGSSETFADVQDFYIDPSMRSRGIGRRLAGLIMQEASKRQAVSIELNVSVHNESAMQFWQHIGFKLRSYSMEMAVRRG